jgi:hypothetical protein
MDEAIGAWIPLGHFRPLLTMAEWDVSIRPAAFPLGQNRQKWPTNRTPGNPGDMCQSEWASAGSSLRLVDSWTDLFGDFAREREESIPKWRNRFRLSCFCFWGFGPFAQEKKKIMQSKCLKYIAFSTSLLTSPFASFLQSTFLRFFFPIPNTFKKGKNRNHANSIFRGTT